MTQKAIQSVTEEEEKDWEEEEEEGLRKKQKSSEMFAGWVSDGQRSVKAA